ncbi:ABC transporter permease [Candidatus Phytoplasma phoenicium]|uniref:ABC transporter permease n=1 Tax=Candidatus Phytoplasma phoenicium TaxID=198422 RepID=A0A2S8NTR8_9MOLU|nr:ABC transporter permease [Candidatus Phytoplasma phoenicium]
MIKNNFLLLQIKKIFKIMKNKNILCGAFFLTILFFFVCFRSFLNIPDPYVSSNSKPLQSISSKHWLGTDETGYDLFSRVLEGTKVSLRISIITVIISSLIGSFLGLLAGYFRSFLDHIIIFLCDLIIFFPDIIIAILIMLMFTKQKAEHNLIIILTIAYIPSYIRIIRANTLTIKQKDFVKASKALGANDMQIIKRHILPNILSNLITKIILNISSVILAISSLGFIGLGLDRSIAEWGNILYSSKNYILNYPHLFYGPFIIIFCTIFSLNLIGKGLISYFEKNSNN